MLVYREGGRWVDCARELARLRLRAGRTPHSTDSALGLLIELAEFESGVADALAPDRDGIEPISAMLRGVTVDAAREWLAALNGQHDGRWFETIDARLGRLQTGPLPRTIELRVSEG